MRKRGRDKEKERERCVLTLYNYLRNNGVKEVYSEPRKVEGRRGILWWKTLVWRLKGVGRSN
jgi:hypothetical protein